jgi:hypothetical protein
MYHNNATQPEGLHMIVRKKQTLGGERGGGGTENNRRGRLLKHTNKFTQWSYLCDFCAKSNRMRKLTHRKSSATHPAPSQSVVTIVSLHDDKQQQDWPPDEESTRTLVRCFEWANVVLRKPLGSHSPCTKLKTHYSEQLHCYNNTLLNLVLSEHSPSDNVRIHIMVMLRNTECDVTRTSRVVIGI